MLEKQILDYFNHRPKEFELKRFRKGSLVVLDNKYRACYTGVSLQYIVYDLLKARYRKSDVCKVLYELIDSNKLKAIYCPDVQKIVFENLNLSHDPYWRTSQAKVLTYLENFIKK